MEILAQQSDFYTAQYLDRDVDGLFTHPLWVQQLKQNAYVAWQKQGFPNQKQDEWKYTALNLFTQQKFICARNGDLNFDPSIITTVKMQSEYSYPIVFINGKFNPALSQLPPSSECEVMQLSTLLQQNTHSFSSYLGKLISPNLHGFAALNLLFAQEGAVIRLLSNAKLTKPIQILYFSAPTLTPALHTYRNLIIAEANSSGEIIENFIGLPEAQHFNNMATEVFVAENSNVTHYKIQQEAVQGLHIAVTKAQVESGAQYNNYSYAFGGRLARNEVRVDLAAIQAKCSLDGFYFTNKKRQHEQLTEILHRMPEGTSRQYYRGLIDDRAHATFNGKVHVFADAQKTLAEQVNNNLLLSSEAEIDTRPQLQIDADDVRCTHGATVGQLDDQALFYLQSRGISAATAQALLKYAFANAILQRIPNLAVQHYIQQILLSYLSENDEIRAVL